jgi:hypothetical protein
MTPLSKDADDGEREESSPSTARRAFLQVRSKSNERGGGLLKHGELTIWVGHCAAVGWDSEFDIWRVLFECLLVGGNNTVRTLNLKIH